MDVFWKKKSNSICTHQKRKVSWGDQLSFTCLTLGCHIDNPQNVSEYKLHAATTLLANAGTSLHNHNIYKSCSKLTIRFQFQSANGSLKRIYHIVNKSQISTLVRVQDFRKDHPISANVSGVDKLFCRWHWPLASAMINTSTWMNQQILSGKTAYTSVVKYAYAWE